MPTNASFSLDIDMVKWVETHIEMQGLAWEELIDPALSLLLAREENAAFQVLEIVLQYTKTAPQVRPSSWQACDLLFHVFNNRMMDNLVCTS